MTRNACFRILSMVVAAFIAFGAVAHAGKFTVENATPYEIRMAFKFYDYRRKEWVVWGWYTVRSGETKSWTFRNAPDRKVYWFGKTTDWKRKWPGKGDHGQSVIGKKMDGIKASALKTYADSRIVQFATRDSNAEGNLKLRLVMSR